MDFIYIDGDNIGLTIEMSFLNNDEKLLKKINLDVVKSISKITEYLVLKNQEIIFSGADGIICKGENIILQELLEFTRIVNSKLTFSIGSGKSLKDCYIALRYAKSYNKNIAVAFQNDKFEVYDGIKINKV